MKRYFIIILLILTACQTKKPNQEIVVITDEYSVGDLTEIELPLYEVNGEITIILDSIIDLTTNCELYKNLPYGFVFISDKNMEGKDEIHVGNVVEIDKLYYGVYTGIFNYKGYRFAFLGKILDEYFTSCNRKEKVFYISDESRETVDTRYGEFFTSYWDYIYEEGDYYCYHYNYCGGFWLDTAYVHADE